ncbi:zinc finger protein 180-like [Gigantopelta aegis]|uniref:zinc finger protein 180-like n=1 Tax=Gigantopelta aegis TaxID=1735272 RepID=UPI001B88C37F|nr:zinc finger protein 180-like [Gigantopelta aegis]
MADKRQFLNTVTSVQELEAWAHDHNLEECQEVNLKRIELLSKELIFNNENTPSKTDYVCNVCQRCFKWNKDLLRHTRTVHGNERFQCVKCGHSFSRLNNYNSHQCSLKRTSSEANQQAKRQCLRPLGNNVNKNSDPCDVPARLAKCNWCGHVKCLLPGKRFCEGCSTKGRECSQCHRPKPERFYSQRVNQCDRCIHRRERYEERRNQVGAGRIDAL